MQIDRTSVSYGTALLTVTGLVSQGLGFVYRVLLSRMIGAEVMGLYQLVMPVYSVVMSLTAVGLTAAVSHLSARYQALGSSRAARQTLGQALGIFFALFGLVAAVTALLSDPISAYVLGDARTQLGLLLLLPCILLTGIENLHKHAFYGTGRLTIPAVVELLEQFIRTGTVLLLLYLLLPQSEEKTVGIIVLGMCSSEIFSAVTLALLFRRGEAAAGAPEEPKRLRRRIASIALPMACTSLLGNLMGAWTSILIPNRLVRLGMEVSEAMGAFGVLCGMTLPMLFLPTAFLGAMSLVLMPRLSHHCALGQTGRAGKLIGRALFQVSAVTMPALALLTVLGPPVGRLLYRESRVGEYILPLAIGVLLSCWQSILACALNGLGRQGKSARNAIVSGAVELGCTFLLMSLPGVGLGGYVAGFVLSGGVGALLNWREVKRETGLRLDLFRVLIAPALGSALVLPTVRLLFRILTDAGMAVLPGAGWCVLFGAVLYLAALLAQGVGRSPLGERGRDGRTRH